MSYPVVAEIWTIFETTLQTQARRLVEDIAKHNHSDPKALWEKIKPQVKISLVDIEVEPKVCPANLGNSDGAIHLRCRAPCMIGFKECPKHVGNVEKKSQYKNVDRVLDHTGQPYFVDEHSIAHDKNGRSQGYVKGGVLFLFEKA